MSESARFIIGSEVLCSDGDCGDLRRVVVDPVARAITHLVVEPRHHRSGGHLVPIELVDASPEEIRLRCTRSEFETLDDAEDLQLPTGASGEWDYDQESMLSLPYYRLLGSAGMGVGGGLAFGAVPIGGGHRPHVIMSDSVPGGEVEVRRGEQVHATDGAIGRVRGLVVDPADHTVTHVLLDEGHLWGQKRVAIPISAVTGVADGVRLSLTKDQVRDLPEVDVDHTG